MKVYLIYRVPRRSSIPASEAYKDSRCFLILRALVVWERLQLSDSGPRPRPVVGSRLAYVCQPGCCLGAGAGASAPHSPRGAGEISRVERAQEIERQSRPARLEVVQRVRSCNPTSRKARGASCGESVGLNSCDDLFIHASLSRAGAAHVCGRNGKTCHLSGVARARKLSYGNRHRDFIMPPSIF